MEPSLVRDLLENEEDVITPAIQQRKQLLDHVPCPTCGDRGADIHVLAPKVSVSEGEPVVTASPFSQSSPIVEGYAKCRTCACVFEPMTRVIVEMNEAVITAD